MHRSNRIVVFANNLNFFTDFHENKHIEIERAKGAANLLWNDCENYKWVWENAIPGSVKFHVHWDFEIFGYRARVTAEFEPEDLTFYHLKFGD